MQFNTNKSNIEALHFHLFTCYNHHADWKYFLIIRFSSDVSESNTSHASHRVVQSGHVPSKIKSILQTEFKIFRWIIYWRILNYEQSSRMTYLALVSGPLASSIRYGIELFPINLWTIVYGCFVCFDKVYSHPYSTPFIKSEFPIEYLSNFRYLLHFMIVKL